MAPWEGETKATPRSAGRRRVPAGTLRRPRQRTGAFRLPPLQVPPEPAANHLSGAHADRRPGRALILSLRMRTWSTAPRFRAATAGAAAAVILLTGTGLAGSAGNGGAPASRSAWGR